MIHFLFNSREPSCMIKYNNNTTIYMYSICIPNLALFKQNYLEFSLKDYIETQYIMYACLCNIQYCIV